MRVLIYMPFSDWVPHFSTDLEIAAKHINNGDEVHVIQCSGDLPSCILNAHHFKLKCLLCKSTRNRGLNLINLPKQNRHELALNSFMSDINLPEFSSMKELKSFKIDNADIGMAVASTLISMVREPNPDINQYKSFINKNLSMSIAVYDAIKSHLEELNPDIFYLFNGRFASLRPALRAAQALGIKTFVHERAGVLNKYSLTEDTYPHDIEYQKKQIENYWNSEQCINDKYKISKQWFEERRGGIDQSWFSFTKSQIKGALPEGFEPLKRNIAIFISSEDEFEAIAGWKNPIYKNQTDAIYNIINSDIDDDIVFHLRIHPNLRGLKNTQTQELSQLNAPNLNVIPADSKVDSYQLMDACEKIITFGSTMGIECAFWDKPSILVGRALHEGVEGCYIPKNHNEFIDLINGHLNPANKIGALKYAYWQAVRGQPYIYYSPESVSCGKFMGKYLKKPVLEQIERKSLAVAKKPTVKSLLHFMQHI
ncbi:hypothetical protein SAMN04488587_1721 [Methanococcoides vulcani]|uniref:Capsule polysaccharide biosynthesis protein n=1 Tax=Methanococcoides vulcani TaxID=1353158 RepID=A0A1I0ANI3_9EURY|nr:hypothetical protein [Methanococcoides vulcani]SES95943.1 hypothetical protein SAMN04488587_1721 [Methanococcoides vulcani]